MKVTVYVIIVFLFLFYPTSSNGVIRDSIINISFDWSIVFILLAIVYFLYGKFDLKNVIISLSVVIYLTALTLYSSIVDTNSTFSIARVAPIFMFLLLSSMKVNLKLPMKVLFIIFDVVVLIIIVCNILILVENSFVKNFIINNYSQLYDNATENMFIKKRPIFTFGIYTFASYFYSLIFLLSIFSYNVTEKNKYKLYCYVLLLFNILLVSNFSIISSLFMTIVISYTVVKNKNIFEVLFLATLITFFVIWILKNNEIINYYKESLMSKSNGFLGRYTNTGSLNINGKYLENHPNIGFNIIRNIKLTYTDSGYFVMRLMGGWLLLLPFYYLLFRFLKNNFKNNFLYVLFITIAFEVALPVTIYIKFAYAMLFCITYLSSLMSYEEMIEESKSYNFAIILRSRSKDE